MGRGGRKYEWTNGEPLGCDSWVTDAKVSGINLELRADEVGIPAICDLGEVPFPL